MSPKPKHAPHRVLLSLHTELYDTITRLSRAMDKPRAEVIRELLAQQQPILDVMAITFEQAKAGHKEQVARGLQKLTGEALKDLGEVMSPAKRRKK
jgi:hypothetical protein